MGSDVMKDPNSVCRRMCRWALVSALAVATIAVVPRISAQVVTLTDLNSTAVINTSGTGAGMNDWLVDGVDPLQLQWFWFRADGMTREQRIDTISTATITPTSARQSRIACAEPLAPRGYIGCAASPSSVSWPKLQRGSGS